MNVLNDISISHSGVLYLSGLTINCVTDRPKLSRNNLKLNFKDDEASLTLRLAYMLPL